MWSREFCGLRARQALSATKEVLMALPKIGDVAPDFTLPGVITKPDAQRLDVRLSEYRGRANVVLAFHPFAFTAI